MKKLLNRKKGFTLIELMIVVAIIGILAAIAIPNFIRFQLKAKSSEGKTNLAAIRTAEVSYFSEFGSYVSAAAAPTTAPGTTKLAFPAAPAGFDTIGWAPEGTVYFNYAVGALASDFHATAEADIDADTSEQLWSYMKGPNGRVGTANAGGSVCALADGSSEEVGPCGAAAFVNSGQSVF